MAPMASIYDAQGIPDTYHTDKGTPATNDWRLHRARRPVRIVLTYPSDVVCMSIL